MAKNQGAQLADRTLKLYLYETNVKIIVGNEKAWPDICVPSFVTVDLMMIWRLSSQLGIASPVPKLPMVNVGIDGAKKIWL
jgi:hypothetical protein